MKKLIIISFLLFSSNLFSQNEKAEAKIFFEKIIKSYFDTCSFLIESIADSIVPIGMNEGFYLPKNKIDTNKLCNNISRTKRIFKSFTDYKTKYKIVVYSKEEFSNKTKEELLKNSFLLKNENIGFVFMLLNGYKNTFQNSDYFVVGNFPKNGNQKEVLDGMFWFIVRKTNEGWKIFALHK